MRRQYFVYIVSSKSHAIYIGSTSALLVRLAKHRCRFYHGSHTALYRIDRLVYFEEHPNAASMVARERQLKGWRRDRKIELIERENPQWKDLAKDWQLPDLAPPNGRA